MNKCVFSCKFDKFIWRSLEWISGFFSKVCGDIFSEANVGVDSGSDCGSSLGGETDIWKCCFNSFDTFFELVNVG